MKDQRGLAHIIFIIIAAIVVAGGVGGYLAIKNSGKLPEINLPGNSGYKSLTPEEKADYDQASEAVVTLGEWIDAAQGAGVDSDLIDQQVDELMERRREDLKKDADKILEKDTCEALMSDIEDALKLASALWSAGDEAAGDALWQWAREAFRGFVVDAAMSVGATFVEQGVDLYSMSHEERQELYSQAREVFYDRAVLAQQAQLFGFEDIHNKILRGEYLEPVCVQLWDADINVQYDYGDGFSIETHWTSGARLKDVPIYKYHPSSGLSQLKKKTNEKGYIDIREMWWSDATYDAPYYATVSGDVYWDVEMSYENSEDFWDDTLKINAQLDLWKTDPQIHWTDGQYGPFRDIHEFPKIEMEVPTLLLWKRQPIKHEEEETNEWDETIKYSVNLTPTKRVKVETLF